MPAAPAAGAGWRRVDPYLWGAVTAVFFLLAALAVLRKVTWYLAADQLGYLVFARDLLDGTIFHSWPPAQALGPALPHRTDMLAQTYIWDHGVLYSRYAPGFPIVLAGWTGLFGPLAAHYLNPTVFLALLGTLVWFEWRRHGSAWRGTAVAVLVVVCPTGLTLWALTPTRDLSCHLAAFVGLALLLGRGGLSLGRGLAAGCALGFAASVRPDAVLYLLPAAALAAPRLWPRHAAAGLGRATAALALGVVVGLSPSFAFYWTTTGSPFVPTQAVEATEFLESAAEDALTSGPTDDHVGYPPAWRGTTDRPVSGGGLRLENLPKTFPGNWDKLRAAYGPVLLALAGLGLLVAAVMQPAFAVAVGLYLVAAMLLYSCWTRPYGRYLISIELFIPILVVEGAVGSLDLVRRLTERRADVLARAFAIAAIAGIVLLALGPGASLRGVLAQVTRLVAVGAVLGLAAAAFWPERRIADVAAPALGLALALLGGLLLYDSGSRAFFQRADAERAAATVRRFLPARAVVITSEELGRPAENLEYYAGIPALYLTDLQRWHIPLARALRLLRVAGYEPYVMIPRSLPERGPLIGSVYGFVELVQSLPADQGLDYFVTTPAYAGSPIEFWHMR